MTRADSRRSSEQGRRPGDLSAGPTEQRPADTYFDRLIKYVPAEIIGAYLIIEGLIRQMLAGDRLAVALLVLGAAGIVASWFFAQRVLKVVRSTQLLLTGIAFLVWVAATGGWFATLSVWEPALGTIAVVIFAVLVRIVDVGPLPDDPQSQTAGTPA